MPAAPRQLNSTTSQLPSWRPPRALIRRRYHSCPALPSSPRRHEQRAQHQPPLRPCVPVPHRSLAQVRSDVLPDAFFAPPPSILMSPSAQRAGNWKPSNYPDHEPPDERLVKLGKTLRVLSAHLPTILVHPLPQEILSPNISLHLFPSTHPHLPTVKGKVAYRTALWTAPVAWGCMPSMPIVGNVRLRIMSERMVRAGSVRDFDNEHTYGPEKLVVRWITEDHSNDADKDKPAGQSNVKKSGMSGSGGTESATTPSVTPSHPGLEGSYTGLSSASDGTNKRLSALLGGQAPIFKLGKGEQFTGLFIFSFDDQGRIASHTIEHADDSTSWDKTAKVVTLTDWLLGKAKRGANEPEPALNVALHPHETHRLAFKAAMSRRGGYGR